FENDPAMVDSTLGLLGIDEAETRRALIEDYELTQSYPGFVTAYAEATGNAELAALAADKEKLRAYLEGRQIYDVIREHPAQIEPDALLSTLRKMQPRLYSIASTQAEVEDEVHLTVGVVEYGEADATKLGGASGFLGRRAEEGGKVKVFVESNDGFRLPGDPATPILMVGPGTGIAPFRAFLQEREAQGAEGSSWLFFGNPHFTQDFLYQTELQAHLKSGTLSKLSVAFSRDQAEKVYVQDRLRENASDVFAWLEKGAHVYICGDGARMARDVENALLDIIASEGAMSEDAAQAYLSELRDARRYQRDVY
ncbi:MAG: sulfite reductase [NADPH] flavoprotein alpha-component, partial [Pseudomonadota bacterium]